MASLATVGDAMTLTNEITAVAHARLAFPLDVPAEIVIRTSASPAAHAALALISAEQACVIAALLVVPELRSTIDVPVRPADALSLLTGHVDGAIRRGEIGLQVVGSEIGSLVLRARFGSRLEQTARFLDTNPAKVAFAAIALLGGYNDVQTHFERTTDDSPIHHVLIAPPRETPPKNQNMQLPPGCRVSVVATSTSEVTTETFKGPSQNEFQLQTIRAVSTTVTASCETPEAAKLD